jgi:hypothetical protein
MAEKLQEGLTDLIDARRKEKEKALKGLKKKNPQLSEEEILQLYNLMYRFDFEN